MILILTYNGLIETDLKKLFQHSLLHWSECISDHLHMQNRKQGYALKDHALAQVRAFKQPQLKQLYSFVCFGTNADLCTVCRLIESVIGTRHTGPCAWCSI